MSAFEGLLQFLPFIALLLIVAASIAVVVRGADLVVDEAVRLATRFRMSKLLIGATIVSIGTTLPEAAVSIIAAGAGTPAIALGNAAGSVICNIGLILGLTILIAPPAIERASVHLYGRIQLATAVLLPATVLLFRSADGGGTVPRAAGLVYLAALLVYLTAAVYWARSGAAPPPATVREDTANDADRRGAMAAARLVGGIALVVGGSRLLVPAVQQTALRLGVPESIVAATLVAFGTSVPELVTAVAASRKGHGELAVGNVIGANILNVLLVVGASAAVSARGLRVSAHAATLLLPAMLGMTVLLRLGVCLSRERFRRSVGAILLAGYCAITLGGYLL